MGQPPSSKDNGQRLKELTRFSCCNYWKSRFNNTSKSQCFKHELYSQFLNANLKTIRFPIFIFHASRRADTKERRQQPFSVKQLTDEYLEADRVNRKDTKTGDENAYILQAEISRRNFGASEPLTTRHIRHIIKTRGK